MKKRILISGEFDLFHYGHMILLKKCRELYPNDILIVGIHTDEECAQYKRRPILTYEERERSIREFGIPDEIIECPLLETRELYEKYNIDKTIHAHKKEEHEYYVENCYKDGEKMGIFQRLEYTSEISTSEIIQRIHNK